MKSDQRPASRSNFCSYQGIDSTRLNSPAAQKVLPWQQDGNGDHNVFMVLATWGCGAQSQGTALYPEPDVSGQNHSTQDSSRILRSHDRMEGGQKKESVFENDDKKPKIENSLENVE